MDERTYLKVKVKSLADEARIIRKEIKKARLPSIKNGLRSHNVNVVRKEARHTLLAYGFLRGRSYQEMESSLKSSTLPPDWDKVRKMVQKYGSHCWWNINDESETYEVYEERSNAAKQHLKEVLARFDEWVEKAKDYLEKQRKEDEKVTSGT
jgi:hypothetical protein